MKRSGQDFVRGGVQESRPVEPGDTESGTHLNTPLAVRREIVPEEWEGVHPRKKPGSAQGPLIKSVGAGLRERSRISVGTGSKEEKSNHSRLRRNGN